MTALAIARPAVLIIEDEETQRHLLRAQLEQQGYRVYSAAGGTEGLAMWGNVPEIRIVLSDLSMPDLDGVEVVKEIRRLEKRYTYLMVLTISEDKQHLLAALEAGADDFVTKPILREELRLRLLSADRLLRLEDQYTLIAAMAELAALRGGENSSHFQRTKRYCALLAEDLSRHQPQLGLTAQMVDDIANASVLHDIGIINIADSLLGKRGRLSDREYAIIQDHTRIGGKILKQLYEESGSPYMLLAHDFATSHHERWDGGGYPLGLQGEAIPLVGRIMALADVYDALRSRRPYKDSMPREYTEGVILAESGRQFDPLVVESFQRVREDFDRIHETYRDKAEFW